MPLNACTLYICYSSATRSPRVFFNETVKFVHHSSTSVKARINGTENSLVNALFPACSICLLQIRLNGTNNFKNSLCLLSQDLIMQKF
jgi:hypothetical protein